MSRLYQNVSFINPINMDCSLIVCRKNTHLFHEKKDTAGKEPKAPLLLENVMRRIL
jgi:hypothetical protein